MTHSDYTGNLSSPPFEAASHGVPLIDGMLDSIPTALILLAPVPGYRLLRINAAAIQILGLDSVIRPASLNDHLPYYLSPLISLLKTATQDIPRGEMLLHLPGREEESVVGYYLKHIEQQESGLPGEKAPLILFIFSDITQVRQDQLAVEKIKDELHQSKKLASLGTLVAGVAHEMNNPLAGISMSASLLRMNLERLQQDAQALSQPEHMNPVTMARFITDVSSSVEQALRSLMKIGDSTARAGLLVSDLLSYSKPMQMALMPLPLDALLSDMLSTLKGQPEFARMSFLLEKDTTRWILGDRIKLEQVFYNLLKNCSDATQGEGTVWISYTEQTDDTGRMLIGIHLQDNGPGIEKTILERIFDPFFTTKGHAGVGLGLSICYRIIEQHGGRLSIDSLPGKGAHQTVLLPVCLSGEMQNATPRDGLPPWLANERETPP